MRKCRSMYKERGAKKRDTETTEESRQEYREMQHTVKVQVTKAKQRAYDDLYARLNSREVEVET